MGRRGNTADNVVDLTGDSDSDDAIVTIRKSHNKSGNQRNDDSRDVDEKSSDRHEISNEAMRRLRVEKFSVSARAAIAQKSVHESSVNDKTTIHSSASASSTSPTTFNSAASSREGGTSASTTDTAVDIEPPRPTNFAIAASDPTRYIIYMAIRERSSDFSNGLAKCNAVCHEDIKSCLQIDGTRHCTMFDGYLTSGQVRELAFEGDFDPLDIVIDGWQHWDAGCYLKLNEESEKHVRDLLGNISGLPLTGGKRPCDHITIYRTRPRTEHPNPKGEFHKIREATSSHYWGTVEGVSIRVKAFGGPYEECRVLIGDQNHSRSRDQKIEATCDDASQPQYGRTLKQSIQANKHNANDNQSPTNHETERETVKQAFFRGHSSSNCSIIPLTIVSWNISECINRASAAAPDRNLRAQESARLIREECFRCHFASPQQHCPHLPDIIALQECPDITSRQESEWAMTAFGPSGYVSMGTMHSHCGEVTLLIRKDFDCEKISLNGMFFFQEKLPAVAAIVTLPNKTRVAVASAHLEPFADGASSRAHQCENLMQLLNQKSSNVVLVGDMNMRQKEDKTIENLAGGGWIDAWKESGSNKNLKFSWDSFSNLYHANGFGFTARFDRAYVRGKELSVSKFGLVGNQPLEGLEGDYLSDHFGLIVEVTVTPSSNVEDNQSRAAAESDITERRQIKNDDRIQSSDSSCDTLSLTEKVDCISKFVTQASKNKSQGHNTMNPQNNNDKISGDKSTAKFMTNKSNNAVFSTKFGVNRKEKGPKPKPKKRCRFESSSSEDDDDEKTRLFQEKLGNNFKKRKRPYFPSDHSSVSNNDSGGNKKENYPSPKAKKRCRFESSSSEDDDDELRRLFREKNSNKFKKCNLSWFSSRHSSREDR